MRSWLVLPLFLAACGGGGAPVLGSAALSGTVFQVDGQTVDRSGVTVQLVETGALVTTDAAGQFAFENLDPGLFTLRFARAGIAGNSPDDDGTPDQGPGDVGSIPVGVGDDVDVKVAVDGDRVTEVSFSRRGRVEVRMELARAVDSPDPDVEGKVTVRSGDGEKFEIEAENLAPGDVVEFFVDGTAIGTAIASARGEAELELETEDGDTLPLGVTSVADLEGLAVEARLMATGETLLTGSVPELPAAPPADDNGGNGGGDDDGRTRGRNRLAVHSGNLEGYVEIRSRPERSREIFKIEAENLAAGDVVEFFLDGVSLGTLAADSEGEAEFKRDTANGQLLPNGAVKSADLVGLLAEVKRSDTGELLLSGFVPQPVAD